MNFKTVIFFLSHIHKFRFQHKDTFFECLSPFSGFSLQSNPHSEDPFLILGNTRFHNRFYNGLLLLSRAPQDSIDINSFFKSSSVI